MRWSVVGGLVLVGCAEPAVVSLQVTPEEPTVAVGAELLLTATATLDDGTTEDVTDRATWTSSEPDVAMVDLGQVTGLVAGAATVSAELDGAGADALLTVTDPGPYDVAVWGDWGNQHGGQGLTFYARVVDDTDGVVVACGSMVAEDAVWELGAADLLVAGHTYHAEAFADVNGDGEQNDPGHAYLTDPKRPADADQRFNVAHAGPAPATWSGPACAGEPALTP